MTDEDRMCRVRGAILTMMSILHAKKSATLTSRTCLAYAKHRWQCMSESLLDPFRRQMLSASTRMYCRVPLIVF